MTTNDHHPLSGTTVLVTRPAHLAEHFCQLVADAGGRAVSLPAIDIVPTETPYADDAIPAARGDRKFAIFISRNAVDYGKALLSRLPDDTICLAVGSRTAAQLEEAGIDVAYHPDHGFTSEDLLEWPELLVLDDADVFIFCGEGGRSHLADELTARGANVTRLEVYRRCKPEIAIAELEEKLVEAHPDVVSVTSVETLRNFLAMTDRLPDFDARALPVIAGSPRIGEAVVEAGFRAEPWIAADPTDDAMFRALLEWRRNETSRQ